MQSLDLKEGDINQRMSMMSFSSVFKKSKELFHICVNHSSG